jgi:hypothetical protein
MHSSTLIDDKIFCSYIKVQFEADFNRNGMKTIFHLTEHKAAREGNVSLVQYNLI